MTSRAVVEDFLAQRRLAVVGTSASGKKFGNVIFKELASKGYELFPVHPSASEIQGRPAVASLAELQGKVDGVVVVVPPPRTEQVVQDAHAAGIRRVWMQQGSDSSTAVQFCAEHQIAEVHGECILMFAEPKHAVHRAHRWLWKVLGKLPQ